jgi:hypothetical protein
MKHEILLGVAALALISTPAWAGTDALGALDPDACKAGVLDNDTAVQALASKAGLSFNPDATAAYSNGSLGTYAEGQGKAYRNLINLARDLVGESRAETADFRVTMDEVRPAGQDLRAIDFLNRKAPWLHIACVKPADTSDTGAAAGEDTGFGDFLIVGSQEDAAKDFAEADPASIAWKRDQRAKTDETSVNLFIGYPAFSLGGLPGNFRPYVAFQKNTGDEPVNDLTFGAQFLYRIRLSEFDSHRLTVDMGWETDDRFDSSVFKAGASVSLWNLCGRLNKSRTWGAMCTPIASVDYLDIVDAGDKTKLVEGQSYGRYGGSFDMVYWRYFGKYDSLKFTAKAGTTVRRNFDGDEANAQMSTASLGVSETGDGFGVGLEWSRGRDLSSLEAQDQIALKFTYKRGK